VKEAVTLAKHYQHLVFFAHALEILLHTIVESEATTGLEDTPTSTSPESEATTGLEDTPTSASPESGTLPAMVEFLDHFDVALDVVVGCARKTEMTRWKYLFGIVGNPHALFEVRYTRFRNKWAC